MGCVHFCIVLKFISSFVEYVQNVVMIYSKICIPLLGHEGTLERALPTCPDILVLLIVNCDVFLFFFKLLLKVPYFFSYKSTYYYKTAVFLTTTNRGRLLL